MEQEDISFTDFIASSIHDMKNSLNMQINSLETIAGECQARGDRPTSDTLAQIIYESNRMNGNLIQLLSLYKMGKSIYPMDLSEHLLCEVAQEAILQGKSVLDFRGIKVQVECDPDCYWYFDRDLVTGILINALNNAYKYTKDTIRVVGKIEDGWLEVRVEDNGRGYPENMLQSGVDSKKGISFSTGSTGLGFYFSSCVARMHKNGEREGSLTIENGGAFGGGCFVVRLP